MAYCTNDEFIGYYGLEDALVSGDRDNDLALDPDAMPLHINAAASIIDSFLVQNKDYTLPLNETPDSLRQANIEIAAHTLSQNTGSASTKKLERYEFWLKYWLPMLAKGDVGLGDIPADPSKYSVQYSGTKRVFTYEGMRYMP